MAKLLGTGATTTTPAKDSDTRSPLDFTSDPGAKPDGVGPVVLTPPTELHSVGGLTGLVEKTRKRFGDAMGFRLVVYPTTVGLMRGAPESLHMRGSDGKPTYLVIEPATDPTTPVALSLSVHVSSAYILFAGDGTIKRINLRS